MSVLSKFCQYIKRFQIGCTKCLQFIDVQASSFELIFVHKNYDFLNFVDFLCDQVVDSLLLILESGQLWCSSQQQLPDVIQYY